MIALSNDMRDKISDILFRCTTTDLNDSYCKSVALALYQSGKQEQVLTLLDLLHTMIYSNRSITEEVRYLLLDLIDNVIEDELTVDLP